MPMVGMVILFNSGIYLSYVPIELKRLIYIVVFLGTVVLPLTIVPLFLYSKSLHNLLMDERKDRIIPLLIINFLYYLTYYWFNNQAIAPLFRQYMLAITVITFCTLIISFFWKISLHMIGIGGITALVIVLAFSFKVNMLLVLVFVVMIAGLLGSARLKLGAHTPSQVFTGFTLGFILMFFMLKIQV